MNEMIDHFMILLMAYFCCFSNYAGESNYEYSNIDAKLLNRFELPSSNANTVTLIFLVICRFIDAEMRMFTFPLEIYSRSIKYSDLPSEK